MIADVIGGDGLGKALKIAKIVGIVIIAFFIINIISSFFKKIKKGTATMGDQAGDLIVQQQTGVTVARQEVCRQVASDVWNNLHSQNWGFFTEYWENDEAIAIALRRLVTAGEAAYTSQEFRALSGDSLRRVVEARLDQKWQDTVNPTIINALS